MDIKYQVVLSVDAGNDLDEIFSYIANILYAEQAAKKLMLEIHECILSLNTMPQRWSYSLDPVLARRGYRRALVKKYVILFRIDESEKKVNVTRVFHGSMNYAQYI